MQGYLIIARNPYNGQWEAIAVLDDKSLTEVRALCLGWACDLVNNIDHVPWVRNQDVREALDTTGSLEVISRQRPSVEWHVSKFREDANGDVVSLTPLFAFHGTRVTLPNGFDGWYVVELKPIQCSDGKGLTFDVDSSKRYVWSSKRLFNVVVPRQTRWLEFNYKWCDPNADH